MGHEGEDYAAKLLEKEKGFVIIERNWHYRQKEIDIIAIDSGTLVFVEVKTRTSDSVPPSELISYNKIRFLARSTILTGFPISRTNISPPLA